MLGFPGGSDSKASAGDPGSIPGSGRSPGEGNGSMETRVQSLGQEDPLEKAMEENGKGNTHSSILA